ncbi:hypothetical protein [Croceitalea sp. MTPC5]|uniref:hypothetical protein n=1 Tax=Croceitalea sp. MTPC5 TaxID=3056565 RepID=UPI0030D56A0C
MEAIKPATSAEVNKVNVSYRCSIIVEEHMLEPLNKMFFVIVVKINNEKPPIIVAAPVSSNRLCEVMILETFFDYHECKDISR